MARRRKRLGKYQIMSEENWNKKWVTGDYKQNLEAFIAVIIAMKRRAKRGKA